MGLNPKSKIEEYWSLSLVKEFPASVTILKSTFMHIFWVLLINPPPSPSGQRGSTCERKIKSSWIM
jgi:hypothetical protein